MIGFVVGGGGGPPPPPVGGVEMWFVFGGVGAGPAPRGFRAPAGATPAF